MKLEIFSKKKKKEEVVRVRPPTIKITTCIYVNFQFLIFLDYIFNKRRSTNITSYRIVSVLVLK